jgi:type IV secretion system protein VirB4
MPFDTTQLPQVVRNIGMWAGANELDPTNFMPYYDHCSDDVVVLKDGRLMAMIKIEPVEFYLSNNSRRNGNRRRHFALLQLLASPDVEIYEHHVCHNNVKPFDGAPGGSAYWQEFYERYSSRVLRGLKQYDWFITVIVKPSAASKSFLSRFFKSTPLVDDYALRLLNSKVRTIMAAFRNQNPIRLGSYTRHGVLFSAIGKAIGLITTTRDIEVPYAQPEGNLGYVIYRERVAHGPLGFLIERGGGRTHASVGRMYGMNVYPKKPRVGMFDDLASDLQSIQGARWTITNYMNPIGRAKANQRLDLLLKRLETSSSRALLAAIPRE